MSETNDPLDTLREIIGAWPETEERLSHGAPTFWGGKKTFASFHLGHHGDGRVAVWCKSDLDTQEGMVAADPDRFFRPPYVGPSGWIGIDLEPAESGEPVDWGMVADLLEEGYRKVARRRALRLLDRK